MPRLRPSNSSAYTPSPAPGQQSSSQTPHATNIINAASYESPTFPLTPAAREKMDMLLNQYPSQALNTHLKAASDGLVHHVGEINSFYRDSNDQHARRAGSRVQDDEGDENSSSQVDQLQEKVTAMTGRMETSIRKCIDAQAGVDAANRALREVQGNAQHARNTQATQATAAVTQDGEANVDEDEDERPEALKNTYDDAFEKHNEAYLGKQPKLRYKEHQWYKNFKTAAHYAAHGEEGPHLNPDTWFGEEGGPRPGETARVADDDDFEEMGGRISTKCPLTLQEFREPVTSKKCPHSFEKSAIEDFLKHVRPPTRGRNPGWTPEIECPVPGCDNHLSKDDLEQDIRIKTLIKRKQRRQELARLQAQEENGDRHHEERNGRQVEEIDSDSEDDIDNVERSQAADSSVAASIKREKARRATQDVIEDMDED